MRSRNMCIVVLALFFAAAGVCAADEVTIENEHLTVAAAPGKNTVALLGRATKTRVELVFLGADGKEIGIEAAETAGEAKDGSAIRVSGGGMEADIKLGIRRVFAEVTSLKGASKLEVRVSGRYVLLPDFFADDVLFDARRITTETMPALADNFYLAPANDGNGLVMCVWQGFDESKGQEEREESVVDLDLAGEGETRRFRSGRIAFPGKKPVYVAVLEAEGIWHAEDVAEWEVYKTKKIDWARPFEARWRTDFLAKEGQRSKDFNVQVLSFYFPEEERAKDAKGVKIHKNPRTSRKAYVDENTKSYISWYLFPKSRVGVPDVGSDMMGRPCTHPCWFRKDQTFLHLYADRKGRQRIKKNFHDTAFIYAMERTEDTPVEIFTPVDVIRGTLGTGPCEYIMDLEGLKKRFHGGKKKMHFEGATCGNYETHVEPLLKEWKEKGGTLDDEKKQKLLWLIEDMHTFIAAVNERLHEYEGFYKDVKALCDAEKGKSEETAALVEAISGHLAFMEKRVTKGMKSYDGGVKGWKTKLDALAEKAKGEFTDELFNIGKVRGFANKQDVTLSWARRIVKMIRQETSLALGKAASPETAVFAAKIREMCRKIMRNPHAFG